VIAAASWHGDDEPLRSDNRLCECSWDPGDVPLTSTARALSTHTRAKHREKGAGRCLGRDSYGQPCECRHFTPMGDD
jgi:hypothetical protein